MRLDPARAPITALLLRRWRPVLAGKLLPPTALAALTPNRAAACRRDRPAAIAATTLSRRSTDNARAIHAGPQHRHAA